MSCPFANFHSGFKSSDVASNEKQKLSYQIYDIEADILRMTKHLESMKKKRQHLEIENHRKRLGTVENVEKEFNKIFGVESTPWRHQRHLGILKPLITSIVYTLNNLETRLNEGKVHVHNENIPLKFVELPKEESPKRSKHIYPKLSETNKEFSVLPLHEEKCDDCGLFAKIGEVRPLCNSPPPLPPPAPTAPITNEEQVRYADAMNEIWSSNEFEIGDKELVAEVLCSLNKGQEQQFDPQDGTTYCSDKPDDSFTFDKKD